MKPYDSYKPSGTPWIGEIPSHWEVMPFRYAIKHITTGLNPRDNFVLGEGDNFYVTIRNFENGVLNLDENCDLISDAAIKCIHERSKIEVGDILFASISEDGKAYEIKDTPKNWEINESVFSIRPGKKLKSHYLFYLLTDHSFYRPLRVGATGTTFTSIKQEQLKSGLLTVPPLKEQEAIADYLDRKCASIDGIIATQERRIALLNELKQSVITEAVTRGINPDAPLRDSGIDWIGQIPKHWEVKPLKYLCRSEKYSIKTGPFGSQLKGDDLLPEGDVRVYNQRNVIDNDFSEASVFITHKKAKELDSFLTQPNDILVTSRGTIGKAAILSPTTKMAILHPCLIAVRIDEQKALNQWIVKWLNEGEPFKREIEFNSNATTIDVIYSDTLKNVLVVIPPINEQNLILEYLDKKCARIDSALSKAKREIELLREYKQSVITEAVTGKIKVC